MTVHHRSLLSAILVASPMFVPAHSSMSFSQVLAGLPLPLFPAVIPWMMVFSRLLCLMMWPKCFIFLFLICFTSIGFVLNCSKIQALVLCCRHDTRSSRRYVHISNASIFLVTFFEYAHDSHPYVATAKAVALAMRSLRLLQIVWLFQIVVNWCRPTWYIKFVKKYLMLVYLHQMHVVITTVCQVSGV